MRDISVKVPKSLTKHKISINNGKPLKIKHVPNKAAIIRLKLIPVKKLPGSKKKNTNKLPSKSHKSTKKPGVSMAAKNKGANKSDEVLKTLYHSTDTRKPNFGVSNKKVPIFMAHTTIEHANNSNSLPKGQANAKAKKSAGPGVGAALTNAYTNAQGAAPIATPSPTTAVNTQKTEAKIAAALKSTAKKLTKKSNITTTNKGKKFLTKKKNALPGLKAVTNSTKASGIKKVKLLSLKSNKGAKKLKTKIITFKHAGGHYAVTSLKANRRRGPQLLTRLN